MEKCQRDSAVSIAMQSGQDERLFIADDFLLSPGFEFDKLIVPGTLVRMPTFVPFIELEVSPIW